MKQSVTLITGVTRGIGLTIAGHLAHEKQHVIIGLARDREGLADLPGHFYPVDLSDAEQTQTVLSEVVANHQIDHRVHNAGRTLNTSLLDSRLFLNFDGS